MRICYVLSTSEISGGANRSFIDLVSYIDRKKVVPVVLLRRKGEIENILKQLDIPYMIIHYTNFVTTGNKIKDLAKRLIDPFFTYQIRKFLVSNNIELVHNNSLPTLGGMAAAFDLHIPYICHIRENVQRGLNVDFLDEKKHYEIMNNAAVNLAISNFVCKDYKRCIPTAHFFVLKDGLDIEQYLNQDKKIFDKKVFTIAIYGNLDAQKGQLDAVMATEILINQGIKNIKLKIVGNSNTEYGRHVKRYVEEKGIKQVIFYDPISDQDILRKSREEDDINLICSRAEGLGRVTIESMLTGCLTIAAEAGATPEIIDNNVTGLLYRCNDPYDLANKIKLASLNQDRSVEIAFAGREWAKKIFDIKKYVKKLVEIYENILGGSDIGQK